MKKVFALLFSTLLLNGQNSSTNKPVNIVIILADDLGWADLGCYGNPYFKTPNIDKLCSNGQKYTQFYASAPVCSPSRAALLTGKHPAKIKFTQYGEGTKGDTSSPLHPAKFNPELSPKHGSLAQYLKNKGYTTAMIGKWHLGKSDTSQPHNFGFDYERVADNGITYFNFRLKEKNKVVYQAPENEYLTDKLTNEAVDFLTKNKEKPFFLYLSHFAPHLLLQPKPQKLPQYFFTYNQYSKGRFDPYYAATIESLDDGVGVLIKHLDSLKLLENTLVIFTSDNGGLSSREFGTKATDNSPLREGKGFLYEGGIRVPFIAVWKGKILPSVNEKSTHSNMDIFATITDILENKVDKNLNGNSFKNALLEPQKTLENKSIFWHYPHFSNQGGRPSSAIRKGNYKLIYSYENKKSAMYNLEEDAYESTNIAEKNPEIANSLESEMFLFLKKCEAEKPIEKLNSKK